MYTLFIRPELDKEFQKLSRRDPKQMEIIIKKTDEVLENPHHYKNLRAPLNQWKRVHIDSHFVLTYSIDESNKVVILEDYDHHDEIYHQ
ncbi:MAG: type II toxin-antitoxin system RelE/ParE family toxin [Nanoarchaeota archaeon]